MLCHFFFSMLICMCRITLVLEKPHISNSSHLIMIYKLNLFTYTCIVCREKHFSQPEKKWDVLCWSTLYSKADVRIAFMCCSNGKKKYDMEIVGKTLKVRYAVKWSHKRCVSVCVFFVCARKVDRRCHAIWHLTWKCIEKMV